MSEPSPRDCAAAEEPPAPAGPPPRTSDYYCVDENLPVRFNNPAWFRGYGAPPSEYSKTTGLGRIGVTVSHLPGPRSLSPCTGPVTKLTGAGPPPCMRCRKYFIQIQVSFPDNLQQVECSGTTLSMSTWRRAS
ncbi:piercer of microtubule wall 1 protein isoform X2 [Canis lupus baileyi]|uniref:piercer of microtubule wall 1 protein isoform X2 n=1 Tax=Canis lupus baileyi TaxID=143281 RepID=UPI003B976FC7